MIYKLKCENKSIALKKEFKLKKNYKLRNQIKNKYLKMKFLKKGIKLLHIADVHNRHQGRLYYSTGKIKQWFY